jgi:hypothetical protein
MDLCIADSDRLEGWNIRDSDSDNDGKPYKTKAKITSHKASVSHHHRSQEPTLIQTSMKANSKYYIPSIISPSLIKLVRNKKLSLSDPTTKMQFTQKTANKSLRHKAKSPITRQAVDFKPICKKAECRLSSSTESNSIVYKPYHMSFDFGQTKNKASHPALRQTNRTNSFQIPQTLPQNKEIKPIILDIPAIPLLKEPKAKSNLKQEYVKPANKTNNGFKEFIFPPFKKANTANVKHIKFKSFSSASDKIPLKDYYKQIIEYSNESVFDSYGNKKQIHKTDWRGVSDPSESLALLAKYYEISAEFTIAIVIKYYMQSYSHIITQNATTIYSQINSAPQYFADLWSTIKHDCVSLYEIKPWLSGFIPNKNDLQRQTIFSSIIKDATGNINVNQFIELLLIIKYKRPSPRIMNKFLGRLFQPNKCMITLSEWTEKMKLFLGSNTSANTSLIGIYSAIEGCFSQTSTKHITILDPTLFKRELTKSTKLREKIYYILIN